MPDVIELARSAEYRVSAAPYTPDGIHLYKQTNPLSIPFSFTLHAADSTFCSQGGLSLLIMAANLHALVLPINSAENLGVRAVVGPYYQTASKGPATTKPGDPPNIPADTAGSNTNGEPTVTFKDDTGQSTTAFPPACLLDLISSGDADGQPGIRCYGYVTDIGVRLKGPWLRSKITVGPTAIRNLPTSAEFSFKFTSAPGFSNFFNGSGSSPFQLSGLSAFAGFVRQNLYNTIALTQGQKSQQSYIGIGERAETAPAQPIINTIPNRPQ
jgi:hypothetical protein